MPDKQSDQRTDLPATEAEALAELQQIVGRLRSSVTKEAADINKARAQQLGAVFHSVEIAKWIDAVMRETRKPLGIPPPSRRCRAFQEELDGLATTTPEGIAESLARAGFRPDSEISIQETKDLWNLVWVALKRLANRFQSPDFPPGKLEAALTSLAKLNEALPVSFQEAKRHVESLKEDLSERRRIVQDRKKFADVVSNLGRILNQSLVSWASEDGVRSIEKSLLEGQALIQDRDLVGEDDWNQLGELLAKTHQTLEKLRTWVQLPADTETHINNDEIPLAIERLKESFEALGPKETKIPAPLNASTRLLIERFNLLLDRLDSSPKTIEGLDRQLTKLDQISDWVRRIPEPLRGIGAELLQRHEALSVSKREDLRRFQFDREKERFTEVEPKDFANHLLSLKQRNPSGLETWIQQLDQLHADWESLVKIEDDISPEALERLSSATRRLGVCPISLEAGRLAEDYREAESSLAKIRLQLSDPEISTETLLGQVERISDRFPGWGRVSRVRIDVRNRDLTRRIQDLLDSPSTATLQTAVALAAQIQDPELRRDYTNPIEGLAQVFAALDRARDPLPDESPLSGRIDEACELIQAATKTIEISQGWRVRDRLGAALTELETRTRSLLLNHAPALVQRWLEVEANAASSLAAIERLRSQFNVWNEVLESNFLKDAADRGLDLRASQLQLGILLDEGRFDEGLRLLEEKRERFSPSETRKWLSRLKRSEALSKVNRGEDPELKGVVNVLREFGENDELANLLADRFQTTGELDGLDSLIIDGTITLDWEIAQLARCCHLLKTRKGAELADELLQGLPSQFLAGVLKNSTLLPVAAAALRTALEDAPVRDVDLREKLKEAESALQAEILGRVGDIGKDLEASKERLSRKPPIDSEESDADRLRVLHESFTSTARALNQELIGLDRHGEWLLQVLQEVGAVGQYQNLKDLYNDLEAIREKIRRNRDALDRIGTIKNRVLAGEVDVRELSNEIRSFSPLGLVRPLVRFILSFFADWSSVSGIVGKLCEADQNDGEGLSLAELNRLERRLDSEYQYSLQPNQDRYRLHRKLGGRSFATFKEELHAKVSEWEGVANLRACKEAVQTIYTGLARSVQNSERLPQTDLKEIRDLLTTPTATGEPLLEMYRRLPEFSASKTARKRADELRKEGWYSILEKAVKLVSEER